MESLPDDLVLVVLKCLPVCELCRTAQTCRRLRELADSEEVWRDLVSRRISVVRPPLEGSKSLYAAIERGVNTLITQFLKDTSAMQTALMKERAMQQANLDRRLEAKRLRKQSATLTPQLHQ